jgi:hypothetical protein
MGAEPVGQLLQCHLGFVDARHVTRPDRTLGARVATLQQAADHGGIEGAFLGRPPALGIETIRNMIFPRFGGRG